MSIVSLIFSFLILHNIRNSLKNFDTKIIDTKSIVYTEYLVTSGTIKKKSNSIWNKIIKNME